MNTLAPADAAAREWDAIVIGAGVAGSASAIELARRGASVVLVERARFPRAKVCGGCLGVRGAAMLADLGVPGILAPAPHIEHAILMHAGREARFEIGPYRMIRRDRFDSALVRAAIERGAHFIDGVPARASPDGRVTITTPGGTRTLRARVIIAADGLSGSSLRDTKEFTPCIARASRIGLGAVLAPGALPIERGLLRMLVGRHAYLGLAALEDESCLAGAAIDPRALRSAGGPGPAMGALARQAGMPEVADQLAAARWTGTPALTRRRPRLEAGRILVSGDAAAYAEPFTGEGMTWAMDSGVAAAGCALSIIDGNAAAGEWTRAHCAITRAALVRCRCVAVALRAQILVRGAIAGASWLPGVSRALARAALPIARPA